MSYVPHFCFLAVTAVVLSGLAASAAPSDAHDLVPLIVKFDDANAVPGAGAPFLGGHVSLSRPEAGYAVLENVHLADALQRARGLAHIQFVEPDVDVHALGMTPNDPKWSQLEQYGPRQVGAPEVWDTTLGSPQVSICFVDSGMRVSHEDLRDRYVGGMDFVTGLSQPLDDLGHGTNVAGVAAATTNNAVGMAGVASVGIRVAKVMSSTGATSGSALTDGIRWCTDSGSQVISISLGTTGFSQLLSDTIDYAWSHGAVLVASAGNSGPCTNCIEYPAKFPHVLAVGCFTSWNSKCVASSEGPELDVMAPGDKLLTTGYASDAEYVVRSGTSLSAPVVAGVAALLRSLNPALTNDQVSDLIRTTAQDYGAAGADSTYGWGLVRADQAAQQVGTAPSLPDLAVSSLALSSSSPAAGSLVYANATVSNVGSAASPSTSVQLFVDGAAVASKTIPALAAGAQAAVSFTWTAVQGSHTLRVEADPSHVVAESSEANNAASGTVSVASPPPPPPPPPATVVRGVDLSPDSQSGKVKTRGSITYTLQVTNTGNAVDGVVLSLGTLPAGWSAKISATSLDLAAGQSASFTVTVTTAKVSRGATTTLQVSAASAADASADDLGTLVSTVV